MYIHSFIIYHIINIYSSQFCKYGNFGYYINSGRRETTSFRVNKSKNMANKKAKLIEKSKKKLAKRIAMMAGATLILILIIFAIYSVAYAKKSYLNIYVGNVDVGGLSKESIGEILKRESEEFVSKSIVLEYRDDDSSKNTSHPVESSEIGLVYETAKSTDQAMAVGRQNGAAFSFWQQLKSIFVTQHIDAIYSINQDAVQKVVADIALELDEPEKDYSLEYGGSGKFKLLSDRVEGKRISQDEIVSRIVRNISQIRNVVIEFKVKEFVPQISLENAEKTVASANRIMAMGPLSLVDEDQSFEVDGDTIAGLISAIPDGENLKLTFDSERLASQVKVIAEAIDVEPKNAELSMQSGKVVVFEQSGIGKKLDQDQTKIDIENALISRISDESVEELGKTVKLSVTTTKPEVHSEKIEGFGLKEMVSTGTTSFFGSPSNRIHNISTGANAIHGTLLAPGEVFSTIDTLGEIDSTSGYLEELVIKKNRTVPEFGGGLCQVSTTLFRAALNAGMEIIERKNHKYRVSYYEPPVGMDATIYDPSPDFKFKNNYSSHILIQAIVKGNNITFQFFGTKDGRVVEIGTPEIYDFVDPPPPADIESDTLQPGERKRIERGHQGASAKFHYKVARGEEILQEKDFLSKYVPWQERWLVGPSADQPEPAPEGEPPPETPAE